jgi:hypothetical protein
MKDRTLTRDQVEFHVDQIKHGYAEFVSDHADVILACDAAQREELAHYRAACASVGETDGHGWAETTKELREQVAALQARAQ